jgi:hypothetical protein
VVEDDEHRHRDRDPLARGGGVADLQDLEAEEPEHVAARLAELLLEADEERGGVADARTSAVDHAPSILAPVSRIVFAVIVLGLVSCKPSERKLCKVNEQCFVCSDEKSLAKCIRDPAAARCKWTPPENCK